MPGLTHAVSTKSSSAELSEAINAMFDYYANSAVCYVHLHDLNPERLFSKEKVESCQWFTRGWTLQELIAPSELRFYDAGWKLRGKKKDETINKILASITGIESA